MLIPPSAPALFIVYIETGIGPPLRITLVGPRKSARSFAGRADKRPGNVDHVISFETSKRLARNVFARKYISSLSNFAIFREIFVPVRVTETSLQSL